MGLYRQANNDYAKMKNISDSNLMSQISRDGKTNIEALNAMLKSSDNINGVSLNDFLGSLGAKDRAVAEANLIKGLMDKNSVNGVVDFKALNESLAKIDFQSEFAKELTSQILSKQSILNNTSDILNSLGSRVVKSKGMSQGISADPLKRAETMKANFIVEKLKPLIPYLGNNEALKLHLNRAILNANGDFKLAIKNIENIPNGNLPTPTRNLLNEFKSALKDIEQVVKSQEPTKIKSENQANLVNNSIKGDGFVTYPDSARQIYPHNAIFEVPNEIRQIVDIADRVSASLEWLRSNHPEMFKTQRAVKEVIDYVLKEPENMVLPKKGDGVILLKQNDKKMDEIGINQNSEVFHANKRKLNSDEKKAVSRDALPPHLDADNISLTGRYSVGEKSHLTAFDGNIIPQNAKSEVKEQTKSTQINEQIAKAEPTQKATTTAKEVDINNTEKPHPNTNSRYENIKKFVEGKTNKALDSVIKIYNELYRGVLDDFARAHPSELNLPTNYHAQMENYITKEFLVKHDKEIKEIITQKTSGENRQIALNAFENLKENFDELRSVGIGDLVKPTAKDIKDKIAEIEIKSMSDKELVTQYQKLQDSNARVNQNLFTYLENEIKQREKKLYPFINSDNKDYSYSLEKQLKNRGLMGLKDSDLENIAKERNSRLYLPSYIRENIQKELNINPIREFGTNYAEFYHDGKNAIQKLLTERQGQVAGAFERKELGDIDLVWGEAKTANGDIKGYGLSKIEAKHLNDFASFYGDTPQEKLINGLNEIIKNGKIKPRSGQDGVNIEYNGFIIGINKGFNGAGDNKWVVTAFDNSMSMAEKKAKTARTDNFTSEVSNLSQNSSVNSTTTANKSQAKNMMGGFSTMAMEKAILHLGSGVAGGAINANAEQDPDKKAQAFVKGFLLGAGASVGAIKMLENSAKLAPQLARISQGLARDLPGILNNRPDIIGKALGKTPKDNYNYIFGGENAIGANKAKLKTAQEMAKNGADESQIWAKTGWYKDIDDKWKFEINPQGGKLDIAKLKVPSMYLLNDILKDDELFKAYPELKDLPILQTNSRYEANAEFHSYGNGNYAIFFDYDYLQNATNDEIRSTLYHEIQHAIQRIEGFGTGGNTQNLSYKEYKNLAGEAEARNVQTRLNRTYTKDDAIGGEFNRLLINDIDNPKWQELKQKRTEFVLAGKQDEADKIKKQLDQMKEFLKREVIKNVEGFSTYSPHPFNTLDTNPNEQIVKFDSDVSASVNLRQKAKQYSKFLSEANKPIQVAPNELYKAYTKAKKDLDKPTKKNK
ncbi:LPD23 domain-containing protein [Campylobacter porcelli]|uniref:Large polyvalent protein associated domain-containing protein n=1 Tax=Campylobacter porcelli TaxID=1660073 RepID=A0A1X9SVS9_9BACT|nr:LPD23 domain-containing protein [Campylobacter sp. RM6137]ARR00424.1 hypothetical protein CSUIS_0604 [Campylobacter sp. RM6137]